MNTYKGRIQRLVDRIHPKDIPSEIVQEVAELGSIPRQFLEVKINANKLKNRLESSKMTKPSMSEQEVADLKELLELALITEQKAKDLADLTLKLNLKYEKRIAELRTQKKIQAVNQSCNGTYEL